MDGESDFDPKFNKYVEYADSIIKTGQIEIRDIRANSIDKELKKCDCNAELIQLDSITLTYSTITNINYKAQLNEDGVLHVEAKFEDNVDVRHK